jgi:polyhydroxyalkanoate synthesis regulator phasin
MSSVRDGIEQAVLMSIGAAALTRERAEAAVSELVRRGQIGGDEGKKAVDRLMENVRGAGDGAGGGLVNRIEGGMQSVLHEVGVATRSEAEDLRMRLDELEHRIALLEGAAPGAPAQEDDPE